MKLDIVIPTLNRPEKLAVCVESIARQSYADIRMVIVIDKARRQAFGVWNDYSASMPEDAFAFAYLCDDTKLAPDCIEQAMKALVAIDKDGDGVVGFNQSIRGKSGFAQSAMGIIGRKFADRFPDRQCFCPDFRSFHADSCLGLFARELGRFRFCEQAMLEHFHPAHEKSAMDHTHKLVRDPIEVEIDKRVWEKRRTLGLLWGRDTQLVGRS